MNPSLVVYFVAGGVIGLAVAALIWGAALFVGKVVRRRTGNDTLEVMAVIGVALTLSAAFVLAVLPAFAP